MLISAKKNNNTERTVSDSLGWFRFETKTNKKSPLIRHRVKHLEDEVVADLFRAGQSFKFQKSIQWNNFLTRTRLIDFTLRR